MTYYEKHREDRLAYQTAYAIKTRDRRYEWNRQYYKKKRIIFGKVNDQQIEKAKRVRPSCPTCKRTFHNKKTVNVRAKVMEIFDAVPTPIERESDFIVCIV
jgi:hypothetical protein